MELNWGSSRWKNGIESPFSTEEAMTETSSMSQASTGFSLVPCSPLMAAALDVSAILDT